MMKKIIPRLLTVSTLFFMLLGASSVASAALGEAAMKAPVSARQMASSSMAAVAGADNRVQLRVRNTQLASGTLIREYLDASGKVVAIAWQGPTLPDLQLLLGSYFPRYVQAQKQTQMQVQPAKPAEASHRHAQLRDSDVVIESHGHLRAFQGRAYLPALLPAGFSPDQIQ
jgi:Protein of unknown function (DUF2844)